MMKKKVLAVIMTVAMVMVGLILSESISTNAFGTLAAQAAESYESGDINLDGGIDYLDAMMALRYDAELVELSDDQLSLGDVNGDGAVDSLDAILTLRYDAGLIEGFSGSSESSSASSGTDSSTSSSTELVFCSEEEAVYVLNTNTKKYHLPGCRWVSTIHDENLAYYNGDEADLIAAEYEPCKTCRP